MTYRRNMEYLILDCETSTFSKGNPYSQKNKLCLVGIKTPTEEFIYDIEYSDHGYSKQLAEIQAKIDDAKVLVSFNLKFDCAWLKRFGITFDKTRLYDCQLADFILSGQVNAYPSLNKVAEAFGLEQKLDEVKQLWEQGIDTPQIPIGILTEYLSKDLDLTASVYKEQCSILSSKPQAMQKLVSLSNQDLLVLLEMESNGLQIDIADMQEASKVITFQMTELRKELDDFFRDSPACFRNYNSGDCVSALLYGGRLTQHERVVVGQYKSGEKLGQDRYRIVSTEHNLPRRIDPPKGSELKKQGFYATNEETLRSVKASGEIKKAVDKILELSKLDKLNGTYYEGLPKLIEEKDWEPNTLHGQFNQVVARTGRLSCSSPNLQNLPPEVDQFVRSRYGP